MDASVIPLTSIGVIIILAISLSLFVRKAGQNAVLGYIIAGILLGPIFLNFLNPSDPLVVGFGELGLFILLFYLGLELSLKDFIKAGSTSIGLALIDMAFLVAAGFTVCYIFGFSIMFSLIVGLMMFSTSTAIVAKFAIDRGLIKESATKLAISILILQDFLGIVLLVFITGVSKSTDQNAFGLGLAALVFAVAVFFAVSKVSKIVEKWMLKNGYGITEIALYALGMGLIVATLGSFLGLSTALGAYFAGFALAETDTGHRVKKSVTFLRDFMLVFFFVAFGTTMFYNGTTHLIEIPPIADIAILVIMGFVLTTAIVIINGVVFHLFGAAFGLNRKDSSTAAIMLVPLGEFAVIIATSAIAVLGLKEAKFISPIAFIIILLTVICFQPMYSLRNLHEKIFGKIPLLYSKIREKTSIKKHTPTTIIHLKKFAYNLFTVICFGTVTILFYNELPSLDPSFWYGKEITAILIFLFFALIPGIKAINNLKDVIKHSMIATKKTYPINKIIKKEKQLTKKRIAIQRRIIKKIKP